MAPSYKLTYFDLRGRGEAIRFILHHAGVAFEDNRFPKEQWPAIKPTTPFGKVPVLEEDGKPITQSLSIERYLGRKFKLIGKDEWDALQCDIAAETLGDFHNQVVQAFFNPDAAKKDELKAAIIKDQVPIYLPKFDEQVKKNGGFLVGGQLTWADLHFVATLQVSCDMLGSDVVAAFDNLKAHREKVLNLPHIKAWVAKRPTTPF
ncbi:glutathione S-transferase-like [Ischnura elegans]|uniref:glutathione S-transferase-like n=1 Tax=Ischnura elegans TaxID=197161 RepID=UPI001ED89B26|nr:glutathione S-transferase-like [Ischnura elegans]